MSNQYFVIKDSGKLVKYCGPGGDVTIPEGVTKIGKEAFAGRSDITSITLPNTVTKIGQFAFCNCLNLTRITIPEGVKKIGIAAFLNCLKLSRVILPESLRKIGTCAFTNCPSLTYIYIPGRVKELGIDTFLCDTVLIQYHLQRGGMFDEFGPEAIAQLNDIPELTISAPKGSFMKKRFLALQEFGRLVGAEADVYTAKLRFEAAAPIAKD